MARENSLSPEQLGLALIKALRVAAVWEHTRGTSSGDPLVKEKIGDFLAELVELIEKHDPIVKRRGKHGVRVSDFQNTPLLNVITTIFRKLSNGKTASADALDQLATTMTHYGHTVDRATLSQRTKGLSTQWITEHGHASDAAKHLLGKLQIRSRSASANAAKHMRPLIGETRETLSPGMAAMHSEAVATGAVAGSMAQLNYVLRHMGIPLGIIKRIEALLTVLKVTPAEIARMRNAKL